jgi:hypothetical protein
MRKTVTCSIRVLADAMTFRGRDRVGAPACVLSDNDVGLRSETWIARSQILQEQLRSQPRSHVRAKSTGTESCRPLCGLRRAICRLVRPDAGGGCPCGRRARV